MAKKNAKKKKEIFFPDDIIIDIVSRLPAREVHRFRLVCRRWRDLTSTLDFVKLHMRRSIPMIYVENYLSEVPPCLPGNRLLFDKWWEGPDPVVHSIKIGCEIEDDCCALFSHGGLIVYDDGGQANTVVRILNLKIHPDDVNISLNPESHPNVNIWLSRELSSSEIYGVFFHPLVGEYCTLWRLGVGLCVGADRRSHPYKILNLGPKPCWRDISNPWIHRLKVRGSFGGRVTLLIGECLYWLVEPEQDDGCSRNGPYDVMEFDVRSEKFRLLHCPVPSDVDCVHSGISLLDIDGVLSFVRAKLNETLVNVSIWKLKDGAQQLWVTTNYSIRMEEEDYPMDYEPPIATAALGKNLLLMVIQVILGETVFVCNLELGNAFESNIDNLGSMAGFAHVVGLASLRNCKSLIYMDKEGEVGDDPNVVIPNSSNSIKRI